ncbi:MAG: TonB family protein [Chthoniobacterales bacterium]
MKPLTFTFVIVVNLIVSFRSAAATSVETTHETQTLLQGIMVSGKDIVYPKDAEARKAGGIFEGTMSISPDGSVSSIKVKKSTGSSVLDNSVLKTLNAYKFKPGTTGPLKWWIKFYPGEDKLKIECLTSS